MHFIRMSLIFRWNIIRSRRRQHKNTQIVYVLYDCDQYTDLTMHGKLSSIKPFHSTYFYRAQTHSHTYFNFTQKMGLNIYIFCFLLFLVLNEKKNIKTLTLMIEIRRQKKSIPITLIRYRYRYRFGYTHKLIFDLIFFSFRRRWTEKTMQKHEIHVWFDLISGSLLLLLLFWTRFFQPSQLGFFYSEIKVTV